MGSVDAASLRSDDAGRTERQLLLRLVKDETVRARTVVIASGARYRRLDVRNLEGFEGTSVHYWAPERAPRSSRKHRKTPPVHRLAKHIRAKEGREREHLSSFSPL
jgi:thioredoxin reductase